ncbi:Abi-alpha family protein [Pseudonocardia sp. CA-107938]|uniref:Abi-alpha family protein n=1 Tax=Pseudonocardia sp. CA-107938 TaxID=3240021 RepID=UPI003D8E1CE7
MDLPPDAVTVRPADPARVNGHRAVAAEPARRRGLFGRAVGLLGDSVGAAIGGPIGDAVSTAIDRTVGTVVDTAETAVVSGELLDTVTVGRVVRAVPDIAKVTGELLWRTNRWTVNASLHLGSVVVQGAISGQSAHVLLDQLGTEAKHSLRELLGVADEPDPMPKELRDRIVLNGNEPQISLPDRMRALLDASSDVTFPDTGHPAYVRLLSELAPDEARILRLFAERGPQPSVDVRTKRPFGVGSQLVAPGITMIGRYAGCAHVDRVPAYLNNMFRLGLIWFSREPIPDQSLYDVLEAQEEVEEAMKKAGGGVTVRRSIELTAFGANLCAMCGLLPADERTTRPSDEQTTRQLLPPDAR